jgi:hypothetical protein
MDPDFVRKEYAIILDPSPKEAELCEENIRRNAINEGDH